MKVDIYIITLWKGTNFAKGSGAWESKCNNGKYMELWDSLKQRVEKMDNVEIVLDGKHEYASYLKRQLEEGQYPSINDQ